MCRASGFPFKLPAPGTQWGFWHSIPKWFEIHRRPAIQLTETWSFAELIFTSRNRAKKYLFRPGLSKPEYHWMKSSYKKQPPKVLKVTQENLEKYVLFSNSQKQKHQIIIKKNKKHHQITQNTEFSVDSFRLSVFFFKCFSKIPRPLR